MVTWSPGSIVDERLGTLVTDAVAAEGRVVTDEPGSVSAIALHPTRADAASRRRKEVERGDRRASGARPHDLSFAETMALPEIILSSGAF